MAEFGVLKLKGDKFLLYFLFILIVLLLLEYVGSVGS